MQLSDTAVVAEAFSVNHRHIKPDTAKRYEEHLEHFLSYLAGQRDRDGAQVTVYSAERRHVKMFLNHLEAPGGPNPDPQRRACRWCADRGFPDGREGSGWSASFRKSYLSAIRFLYNHFACEEGLPTIDPSAHIASPAIELNRQFVPTAEEMERLFEVSGSPACRLLVRWAFFAPSRRATFSAARWCDLDIDGNCPHWRIDRGKCGKTEVFDLNPLLVRQLRDYRRWQQCEAERNPAIRRALESEDTAYVLLTRTGKPVRPETIAKMVRWAGVRAGVGVIRARGKWDAPGQKTSRLSPHALRRGWATIALDRGMTIDAVSEVLGHADISTTRRHYAFTKPERARQALLDMRI